MCWGELGWNNAPSRKPLATCSSRVQPKGYNLESRPELGRERSESASETRKSPAILKEELSHVR